MAPAKKQHLLDDYHLLTYDVLDSTNEEAKRLAAGGGSHGAVIWAKRQTDGRGRMGREWVSTEGNLFVSFLLSPKKDLARCAQLSFVAAIAGVETIRPIVDESLLISCKWPNDMLLSGKKLGGILLESFACLDDNGKERQWIVVGVGINIDSYPANVSYPATCLREAGVEIISAKIVLSRLVYHFIQAYDSWNNEGFDAVRARWLEYAHSLGESIEVRVGEQAINGQFDGIDKDGRLLLQQADGSYQTVTAGDVFYLTNH